MMQRIIRSLFVSFAAIALYVVTMAGFTMCFSVRFSPVVCTIFTDVLFSVFCIVWLRYHRNQLPIRFSGKQNAGLSFGQVVLLFVALFVLLWYFGQIMATYLTHVIPASRISIYSSRLHSSSVAMTLLLSLIIAPISEELLMRGVVYTTLRNGISVWAGIYISAFCFAVLHGTVPHLPVTLLFGVFQCILYEYTGRFWAVILTHMAFNGLVSVFGGMIIPAFLFRPLVLVLVLSVIALGLVLFGLELMEQKPRCMTEQRITSHSVEVGDTAGM